MADTNKIKPKDDRIKLSKRWLRKMKSQAPSYEMSIWVLYPCFRVRWCENRKLREVNVPIKHIGRKQAHKRAKEILSKTNRDNPTTQAGFITELPMRYSISVRESTNARSKRIAIFVGNNSYALDDRAIAHAMKCAYREVEKYIGVKIASRNVKKQKSLGERGSPPAGKRDTGSDGEMRAASEEGTQGEPESGAGMDETIDCPTPVYKPSRASRKPGLAPPRKM
jgi:hypothetical protein